MARHDEDHRERLALAERAAEWIARMQQASQPPHAEFAAWLKESPRHVEEALFAVAVARELSGFDRERRIDIQALLVEPTANLAALPLPHFPQRAQRPSRRARAFGMSTLQRRIAAVLVGAVGLLTAAAWWHASGPASWQNYSTALGEQRAIELADGSLVHMNTQSRLAVRFTPQGRDIRLLNGEALFKVHHDARRPFRVHADDAVIQAIGTQFDVYRQPQGTRVAVIEGRVRIVAPGNAPRDAAAGEGTTISSTGIMAPEMKLDTVRITAWRQRRLIFQADTLEDIAHEFNRYNSRSQIRIEGETIRNLRFTGVFDADDPKSLGLLLNRDRDLSFESRGDILVIRKKQTR